MRILITNDDGIYAPGIARLAHTATLFGEVCVVAPAGQCSAMSHRITIGAGIKISEVSDFSVSSVKAYKISGTPADCVKVACEYILEDKPDIVFSGINRGYNAGIDVAYSGTVAAAMEAVMKGIPAIAFSMFYDENFELVDEQLHGIIEQLLTKPAGEGRMWNVNFPEGKARDCKGILWDRTVAKKELHPDVYGMVEEDEEGQTIILQGDRVKEFEENTDLHALIHGYISIGTITNMVMGQ